MNELRDPLWMETSDKSLYKEELKNYYNHPTYSFYGLHESFILGQLGTITIKDEKENLSDDFSAFAIKFKLPGEHKFGETTYNGEL
jgi:hypothetical protein